LQSRAKVPTILAKHYQKSLSDEEITALAHYLAHL
jgi:hypothetical protein